MRPGSCRPDAIHGRRHREARPRLDDAGVPGFAIAALGEGCELAREPVVVVGEQGRRRDRLDQLAEPGDDLGEPGPIAADRRGAVQHGVVVDRTPDLRIGDDRPTVLGVDGDPALLEPAQDRGEHEARVGPREAADVDPADHDPGQDPVDVRLPEGDEPTEHQRDAQQRPEQEASSRATWSRNMQRPDRWCELASDGHQVVTRADAAPRCVKGGSLHDRSRPE